MSHTGGSLATPQQLISSVTWTEKLAEKWISYFERPTVQASIREKVVNPILNHILKRVFPYITLILIMFILLLLSVLITLGVIIFQFRSSALKTIVENPIG